jgi:hypothetical protein
MDRLDHFPRVWCPTCNKIRPLLFDVLKANDKNEHDAADIVCAECKSSIATLHAPDARRTGAREKKVAKASEMAAQEIDRLMTHQHPMKNGSAASEGLSRDRKSSDTFAASAKPPLTTEQSLAIRRVAARARIAADDSEDSPHLAFAQALQLE